METEKSTPTIPTKALQARIREAYDRQQQDWSREQLILDNLAMVRHIAQKVAANLPRRPDMEELISAGTLGLVQAARSFDPARGNEFSTYAYIRVRGAIVDELRRRSFVPVSVHGRIRAVRDAWQACAAEYGRPPTNQELADRAGLSVDDLHRVMEDARNQQFMSIHGLTEDGPALTAMLPCRSEDSPSHAAERRELLERLAQAIRDLPDKERKVILLYYERDLTMKETAAVLEVTESRVSQLHASAVFKLSCQLKDLK
jgi:RNA polymerase sigma factor for flagellar operon FliA